MLAKMKDARDTSEFSMIFYSMSETTLRSTFIVALPRDSDRCKTPSLLPNCGTLLTSSQERGHGREEIMGLFRKRSHKVSYMGLIFLQLLLPAYRWMNKDAKV